MKKVLMTLFVMFAMVTAYAQEMYVGGGISLWRDTDAEVSSFSISPDFGYSLSDKWSVGGQLVLDFNSKSELLYGLSDKYTSFAIAPYARFSYFEKGIVRLFLDMGFGISVTKPKNGGSNTGFEVGVKPGLAVKLNDNFSFITKVGFAGFRDDYLEGGKSGFGVDVDGENISIGIEYAF